jgi:hypothetical protein
MGRVLLIRESSSSQEGFFGVCHLGSFFGNYLGNVLHELVVGDDVG